MYTQYEACFSLQYPDLDHSLQCKRILRLALEFCATPIKWRAALSHSPSPTPPHIHRLAGVLLVQHPAGRIVSPINIPVNSLKCIAACYSHCSLLWFRTTDEDSATNATELSVTNEHWQSTYGISYSLYTYVYQERNNGQTEVHSTLAIYKFAPAYAGTYFCRAVEGAASAESKRIELQVQRTG